MPQIKIQVPAEIRKLETQADHSYKLVLGTPELPPNEAATLFSLKGKAGWFLFACEQFNDEDVPTESVPDFKGEESPMASLQRTIYVFWDKCTNRAKPFNIFLREWADRKKTEIKEHFPK